MPEVIRIIPRAKLTRIADLTDNAPEWSPHLRLLSAEGCLCIMHGDNEPPEKFYLILFDHPNRFRSFDGDLEITDNEIRLITKDTGYVFTITDPQMTDEKKEELRRQLDSMLTQLEAEEALSDYLSNNSNDNR